MKRYTYFNQSFSYKPNRLIAHRGYSLLSGDNTLEAIKLAHFAGIKWIELDIQLTLDKKLVVFHDFSFVNISKVTDNIIDKTLQEIQQIKIIDPISRKQSLKIPSLEDVFNLANKLFLSLNLELKVKHNDPKFISTFTHILIEFLRNKYYSKIPIIISSFSYHLLKSIYFFNRNYRLSFLINKIPTNLIEKLRNINAYSLNCHKDIISKDLISQIKSLNYYIFAYTINDPKEAINLFNMGIDCIFSDNACLI